MKLVMDEKAKHRLIGIAVIISLGAIFAPAVMKKSSQHLDNNFSVNVQLPAKPLPPDVVMSDEKELFKTIKVAKVEIPEVSQESKGSELVKAEPLSSDLKAKNKSIATKEEGPLVHAKPIQLALNEAASSSARKSILIAYAKNDSRSPVIAAKQKSAAKPVKPAVAAQLVAKAKSTPKKAVTIAKANHKAPVKRDVYAVQLASFSQLTNAQTLVNKLRAKGYKANYIRTSGRQGPVYKVYAGHSPSRNDVLRLKTQLASTMQLHGFIVNTGVS